MGFGCAIMNMYLVCVYTASACRYPALMQVERLYDGYSSQPATRRSLVLKKVVTAETLENRE